MKNIKIQIALDIAMIIISLIATILYFQLILTEETSVGKKVVGTIWVIQIIIWSVKLFVDFKQKGKTTEKVR